MKDKSVYSREYYASDQYQLDSWADWAKDQYTEVIKDLKNFQATTLGTINQLRANGCSRICWKARTIAFKGQEERKTSYFPFRYVHEQTGLKYSNRCPKMVFNVDGK